MKTLFYAALGLLSAKLLPPVGIAIVVAIVLGDYFFDKPERKGSGNH